MPSLVKFRKIHPSSETYSCRTPVHNETFNIYSHLIPSGLFLFSQIAISRLFDERFPHASGRDRAVFAFFLMTAAVTLFVSSTFHTMINHSMRLSHLWLRIDYVGILLLILGHFVSGIYVGFYPEPFLQKVYWTMVGITRPYPFLHDVTLMLTPRRGRS